MLENKNNVFGVWGCGLVKLRWAASTSDQFKSVDCKPVSSARWKYNMGATTQCTSPVPAVSQKPLCTMHWKYNMGAHFSRSQSAAGPRCTSLFALGSQLFLTDV